MTSSSEKVLWGYRQRQDAWSGPITEARTQGWELLFTSDRIIGQHLLGGERTFRAVSKLLFGPILAPDSEVFTGGPTFVIDPKRIFASIRYSEISKFTIESNSENSVFTWKLFNVGEAEPNTYFNLDEVHHKAGLKVLSPLLGDKISQISALSKETGRPMVSTTLNDFREYLAEIGLKTAPLENVKPKTYTGTIRVLDSTYDFLVKEGIYDYPVCSLDFIFSNLRGKNGDSIVMHINVGGEKGVELKWRGGDKRLIEHINQNTDLIRSIENVSKMIKFKKSDVFKFEKWTISGMRKQEKVKIGSQATLQECTVHIKLVSFEFLPPIEIFQIMDKMGAILHSLAT